MSYWEDKSVVVTGGAGFIGTHVCESLATKHPRNLFVVRQKDYDLTRETEVIRLFNDHPADIVIHLAGLVGGILPNKVRPAEFYYRNLMMGTLIFHHAWMSGAQKFIAAGAGCGYPEFAPNPLKESMFWDGFPQQESAPYSLAKRMLTIQSEAYQRQYGFPSIVAVPGNVYGPYDNYDLENAHVIPALVRKFQEACDTRAPEVVVWGTGQAARDFVYGGDVAEGMLLAAEKFEESSIVNLSSGAETPIRTIVELLQQITGYEGEIVWDTTRPDGQRHRCFDVTKAQRELGWTNTTSLEEGLRKTVAWYRANQDEARKELLFACPA